MAFLRMAAMGTRSACSLFSHSNSSPRFLAAATAMAGKSQRRAFGEDAVPEHRIFAIEDYDQFRHNVLHAPTPVLVAFHADWSGPCQMFLPRVENAVMHFDILSLATVNFDYCADLAQEFGVESVPTIIGFKHGEEISRTSGVLEEDSLYSMCEEMIAEQ